MTRNWIRRASAAGALVLALTLAAPAQAAGWALRNPAPDIAQAAWQWIARLWAAPVDNAPVQTKDDRSGGIDPNGTTTPTLPCQEGCDRGGGIDPDG